MKKRVLIEGILISRLTNIGVNPFYLNSRGMRELVMKEIEELTELFAIKK